LFGPGRHRLRVSARAPRLTTVPLLRSALHARSTLGERRAWRGARLTIGGAAMRLLLRPLGRAPQISVEEPARDAACERRRRARSRSRASGGDSRFS